METVSANKIELVLTLDESAREELGTLDKKGVRLAGIIRDGLALPEVKDDRNNVTYPYVCDVHGAALVILGDDDCIAITSPRAFEILHGRALPKLRLDQIKDVYPWYNSEPILMTVLATRTVRALFKSSTQIDPHNFSVEFEGATFDIEMGAAHAEGDIYTAIEAAWASYGVVPDITAFDQLMTTGVRVRNADEDEQSTNVAF
jgi:hypothetical protein